MRRFHYGLKLSTTIQSLNLWHSPQPTNALIGMYPEFIPLNNQPVAKWVGDWVTDPRQTVASYAAAANGKTMVLPIYAIPNRDSGGYSAGGFQNQGQYLNWLSNVRDGASAAHVWYILEPDALGLASNLSSNARAERLDTLGKAVGMLKGGSNAKVYIDVSHWLTPATAADLLVSANIIACEGFALNVSNFQTTSSMYSYGNQVVSELQTRGMNGKKYVIDTARNGKGPLTSSFGPSGAPWLNAGKEWCNPPGRGLGLSPRVPVSVPHCAALLYIKAVGESDGNDPGSSFTSNYFGENAPAAGTFWIKWTQDLLAHTDHANLQ